MLIKTNVFQKRSSITKKNEKNYLKMGCTKKFAVLQTRKYYGKFYLENKWKIGIFKKASTYFIVGKVNKRKSPET